MTSESSTEAQARAQAALAVFATLRAVVGSQPRAEGLRAALAGPDAPGHTQPGVQAQREAHARNQSVMEAMAREHAKHASQAQARAAAVARAEP